MIEVPASILSFIDLTNQYGLVVDFSGRILHSNPPLAGQLKYPVGRLDEVFGVECGLILQKIQDAVVRREMIPFEVEMDFGNGIHPIYGQVYPVQTESEYISMLLFHPVDSLQLLEGALFDRKSKLPTDSRWVIDKDYRTLKFSADEDSVFFGRDPGFSLAEAVQIKDHAALEAAFEKAALSPGEMITITVDARRRHGICRVEMDVIFGADVYYGDRYYVMTRPAVNRALDILSRMTEAYQVDHDKKLAARLGVVASAVSNVRHRNREVPPAWIIQCVLDCKVRFRWLYGGVGEKFF